MPRKNPKKLRKFIQTRRSHLARMYAHITTHENWKKNILYAVRVPALALLVYVFLLAFDLLSILNPTVHYLALFLFILWLVQSVRGAVGFWSHRAHLRFFLPIVVFIIFGSCWGGNTSPAAKAWATPPVYAHRATTQIQPQTNAKATPVLAGSILHINWQGQPGVLTAHFNGSTQRFEPNGKTDNTLSFPVPAVREARPMQLILRQGLLRLGQWSITVVPDEPPSVALTETPAVTSRKTMRFAYVAKDDYGVETVTIRITPTQPSSTTPTNAVDLQLAKPMAKDVNTASYIDLTHLPWAGIPVSVQLVALDGAGQKGWSAPEVVTLPTRTFHNPFAKALIEERQKLLTQNDSTTRDEAANVMAGIARQQSIYNGDKVVMMALRAGAVRLVLNLTSTSIDSVAQILWKTAVRLEEGEIGLAQTDLAEAEQALSSSLQRNHSIEDQQMHWLRLQQSMTHYFHVLEAERARQPPALQELDWPLATAKEMLAPEDLENRFLEIGDLLKAGNAAQAQEKLSQLQSLIENLRTTPPELTQAQSKLAQQISSLRALVRSQKGLNEETERLLAAHPTTPKERKLRRDTVSRNFIQQQMLLTALRDLVSPGEQMPDEARTAVQAMQGALAALQGNEADTAQKKQIEALALLQNALIALTDQINRSLTAKISE